MFSYFFKLFIIYFLNRITVSTTPTFAKKQLICFILFSSCSITATAAQSTTDTTETIKSTLIESGKNPLKFSQLSTANGLSNSNVFGVTQDQQGFIWFATEDGLNRFDGTNFVIYRHDANNQHSIADNVIRKIFIDSENTLWVGTQNGLSRYNIELDNFDNFYNESHNESSLRDNVIWNIYQNKNTEIIKSKQTPLLWVSTSEGLHTLSVATAIKDIKFTRIKVRNYDERIREIKTIFQDRKENYWLGSFDKGIHLLSKNLNYIGSLKRQNKFHLNINANALFDMELIDNNYWLATDNGLYIVDERYRLVSHLTNQPRQDNTKTSLLSNTVRAINQFDDNQVWLATQNGLNVINLLNNQIESYQSNQKPTSLSENWLMDIFQDKNNNMWLASYGGGLNKYSSLANLFHHGLVGDSTISYRIESFAEAQDGTIWLATEQNGLFQINNTLQVKKLDFSTHKNIRQILAGDNGSTTPNR